MRYMLFFCGSEEDRRAFEAMSDEELPFLESREDIGGYATIDVADFDAALGMARSWPGRGSVEIRPVVEQ